MDNGYQAPSHATIGAYASDGSRDRRSCFRYAEPPSTGTGGRVPGQDEFLLVSLSPKLGLVYQVKDRMSLFGSYMGGAEPGAYYAAQRRYFIPDPVYANQAGWA